MCDFITTYGCRTEIAVGSTAEMGGESIDRQNGLTCDHLNAIGDADYGNPRLIQFAFGPVRRALIGSQNTIRVPIALPSEQIVSSLHDEQRSPDP